MAKEAYLSMLSYRYFSLSSIGIKIETERKRDTRMKEAFKKLNFETPSGERNTAK